MKLTRVHIIKAVGCGGLLDGLDVVLRAPQLDVPERFNPLCLVGPNGTGKSQFLQAIAGAFQVVFHHFAPQEERHEGSRSLEFEIEYLIRPASGREPVLVRLSRQTRGKRRQDVKIERKDGVDWIECSADAQELLPARVVSYTSGDNETLSVPFLVSGNAYADEVNGRARSRDATPSPDTRLWRIDYAAHMEVLVANLLLDSDALRDKVLEDTRLADIDSFRAVLQLAHPVMRRFKDKGVQLTAERERYVEQLKSCATFHSYDEKTETSTFDFLVNDETRAAFRSFWPTAMQLWSAFHKLSMLNNLAIPTQRWKRLLHEIQTGDFESRVPDAQEEDRVFRFEQIRFKPKWREGEGLVGYVSLSDGEHQLAQIIGTMSMISDANVLFLLDEPESHFNPQWRVKFISRLLDLPTAQGKRSEPDSAPAQQDCLMTTHAPFVPSDMHRENVLIFDRNEEKTDQEASIRVRHPGTQTYGAAFDGILQECFGVRPPSKLSRGDIDDLMKSNDPEEIRKGISRLGDSVDKVFLMDRRRQLLKPQGK